MSRPNQRHDLSRHMINERSGRTLLPKSTSTQHAPPQRKSSHRRQNPVNQTAVAGPSLYPGAQDTGLGAENVVSGSQMDDANVGTVAPAATLRRATPHYATTPNSVEIPDAAPSAPNNLQHPSSLVMAPLPGASAAPHMAVPVAQPIAPAPQSYQPPVRMDLPAVTPSMPTPQWTPPDAYVSMTAVRQADKLRDLDRRVTQLERASKGGDEAARQKKQRRG
ncbi:hypothetical protein VFPPC_11350 [Pochonia chlamydosporia 170]|uniref:Uncharacterized protein n=1 Tax=Pochonia chlamydosporia 170 TaxID=1380566 RepID=A0A179EXJ2_METCM|nr:hypothetical protein VFPPC_11350 [Pochonia chlamydosporia 170]OAQ57891.1 hypothetical protein VFPPC_11350 [Pochonia chlamydosporia 170]